MLICLLPHNLLFLFLKINVNSTPVNSRSLFLCTGLPDTNILKPLCVQYKHYRVWRPQVLLLKTTLTMHIIAFFVILPSTVHLSHLFLEGELYWLTSIYGATNKNSFSWKSFGWLVVFCWSWVFASTVLWCFSPPLAGH